MIQQTFINLAVKDLDKTMNFFRNLGFSFNPQFTDEKAACMLLGSDSFAMLLTEPFFRTFIKKDLVDATKSTEVLTAISMESKDKVDEMFDKAIAGGGTKANDTQDLGFMYSRSFSDPDGHIWELFWMDMSQMPQGEK